MAGSRPDVDIDVDIDVDVDVEGGLASSASSFKFKEARLAEEFEFCWEPGIEGVRESSNRLLYMYACAVTGQA